MSSAWCYMWLQAPCSYRYFLYSWLYSIQSLLPFLTMATSPIPVTCYTTQLAPNVRRAPWWLPLDQAPVWGSFPNMFSFFDGFRNWAMAAMTRITNVINSLQAQQEDIGIELEEAYIRIDRLEQAVGIAPRAGCRAV